MTTDTEQSVSVKPAKAPKRTKKELNAAPALEVQATESKPVKSASPKKQGAAGASSEPLPAGEKVKRAKKGKVVRDSFTMPKSDYDRIAALKQKCLAAGVDVKKSELLRAALQTLDAIPLKRLLAAVSSVETVKTGRPAKS